MYYRMVNDRLETAGKSASAPDQDKLIEYLFFCLAYVLKESRETIQYGTSQYGDPETSFSIVMLNIDHVGYDYATECFRVLGIEPLRECGPVMSVEFETAGENDKFKEHFKSLLDRAEKELMLLNDKTPQEYFFLKTCPVIKEVASTDSKHFVVLQADVQDAVDRLCVEETMQPWTDYERIRDYYEISVEDDGTAEIRVVFYRLRKQKKFVRYLKKLELQDLYGTGT